MTGTIQTLQTVALIGSYVPRRCGIGAFTKNLRDGLLSEFPPLQTLVLSMDDRPEGYDYPEEVRFQIRATEPRDYDLAADFLNINQIDVVMLQHEFEIFGGVAGRYILDLVQRVRMSVITTLHTVLKEPTGEQESVTRELAELSDRLVVMSEGARRMMLERYEAPAEKVLIIPHGVPDVPLVDPAFYKEQFGLADRTVLMTFGLLSPDTGIELAIQALPRIVKRHPDVIYVILGAMHPHVFKREGDAYLVSLERLAAKLGVRDHVVFHSRFVTLEELCRYLGAVDLYIVPYPNRDQVVSGTLAYALGMGKAVVSTPFLYAEEMLANGRGRLFPFDDPEALAATVIELLDDPAGRNAMRKRAYLETRPMVWREVARRYCQAANAVREERTERPRPVFCFQPRPPIYEGIPEINMSHMRALTDDTGILQHAVYAIPDRFHGYCTDDNSRALIAALLYYDLRKDDSILPAAMTYMSFLHHAFNREAKRFRNFMSYDRRWLEEIGSDDVHGRSIWALGVAVTHAPNSAMVSFASRLFAEAIGGVETLRSPRAWALSIVGIHAYLERFNGDAFARRVRADLAQRLFARFQEHASDDWPWCEDVVTYGNAKLPHALILSGQWLPDREMLEMGLKALEWLVRLQVTEDGTVSLIGNRGWLQRTGERARFDQQPIEAQSLTEACAQAYRYTGEVLWRDRMRQCLGWFLGNNDTQSMLYDYSTGGCRDGLHPDGPNLNQGAESTLAWLIALITVRRLHEEGEAAHRRPTAAGKNRRDAAAPVGAGGEE